MATKLPMIVLGIVIGAIVGGIIAIFTSGFLPFVAYLIGGTTVGLIARQNKKIGFLTGGLSYLLSIPLLFVINSLKASLLFGIGPVIIFFVLAGIGGAVGSHFSNKK